MKKYQILFYKSTTKNAKFYDKLIAKYTNGLYSHVEIYDIETKYRYTSSPRSGGVQKVYENYIDKDTWDIVKIELNENIKLENYYNKLENCKYDWLGILGFILPFQDRQNKWFCSEFVSNFLKINGYENMIKLEPSKVSPNKLYKILEN